MPTLESTLVKLIIQWRNIECSRVKNPSSAYATVEQLYIIPKNFESKLGELGRFLDNIFPSYSVALNNSETATLVVSIVGESMALAYDVASVVFDHLRSDLS